MKSYVEKWEKNIEAAIEEGSVTVELMEAHWRHIQCLQHERLVHLLVMLFVGLVVVLVLLVTLATPRPLLSLLLLILIGLLLAYIGHYYYLENSVQRWYKLADSMAEAHRRKSAMDH